MHRPSLVVRAGGEWLRALAAAAVRRRRLVARAGGSSCARWWWLLRALGAAVVGQDPKGRAHAAREAIIWDKLAKEADAKIRLQAKDVPDRTFEARIQWFCQHVKAKAQGGNQGPKSRIPGFDLKFCNKRLFPLP
eukprot:SAG11_NODE_837_length_6925_cov_43.745532_7_plen_135_part_00